MAFLPKELNTSTNGWGPTAIPPKETFLDIPYAPFSKGDKLGKAADWTNTNRQPQFPVRGQMVATSFNTFEDEEEEDFSTVDNRVYQKAFGNRRTYMQRNQAKLRQQPRIRGGTNWQSQGKPKKGGQRANKAYNKKSVANKRWAFNPRPNRKFTSSIEVQPTWGDPLFNIEFSVLASARLERKEIPAGETLSSHGRIEEYNPVYNKVSTRFERNLERQWAVERKFYQVTTSDDPVLLNLVKQNAGNVYATDSVLAVLMSALRSAYSWDILVTVDSNGNIFLDKRDDSLFDFHTVNENSSEPPADDAELGPNAAEALSKEATFLNYNFSQQLLFKDPAHEHTFEEKNPFQSTPDEKVASVGYLYRSFDLGDDIKLVARTEVDGFEAEDGKQNLLCLKALNEYDPRITGGWRKKLESQKAGCFATELKNNNCKLTKWMIQAHLAGASSLRIGYVSRLNPKDPFSHVILTITEHAPAEFVHEIGSEYAQLWGSLKHIIEQLKKLKDEGTYIILRDPNKKQLQVYKVPTEEFKRPEPSKKAPTK
jgi:translation initiation factor 3 subunit D